MRPPDWAMAAFCSWNLWPRRSEPLMNLSTQRIVQPSSLDESLDEVNSSTQCSKQRCTRLLYIYSGSFSKRLDSNMVEEIHTFMNCDICFFSMRMASSRCSLALRLDRGQRLFQGSAHGHSIPVHFASVRGRETVEKNRDVILIQGSNKSFCHSHEAARLTTEAQSTFTCGPFRASRLSRGSPSLPL